MSRGAKSKNQPVRTEGRANPFQRLSLGGRWTQAGHAAHKGCLSPMCRGRSDCPNFLFQSRRSIEFGRVGCEKSPGQKTYTPVLAASLASLGAKWPVSRKVYGKSQCSPPGGCIAYQHRIQPLFSLRQASPRRWAL